MKTLLAGLLALLPFALHAVDAQAERTRIAAERRQADARFAADEKACRAKFAVTDCIEEARARQRETLAQLRRQEVTLNDIERKRKAADKLREIDERTSPERQAADARERAQAVEEQRQREAAHAEKAARRRVEAAPPAEPVSSAPREAKRATPEVSPAKAAANRREHDKRLAEAAQRRAQAEKRMADRKKPAASGLPVPP